MNKWSGLYIQQLLSKRKKGMTLYTHFHAFDGSNSILVSFGFKNIQLPYSCMKGARTWCLIRITLPYVQLLKAYDCSLHQKNMKTFNIFFILA